MWFPTITTKEFEEVKMQIGDCVIVYHNNVKVPRRDVTDSPRDAVMINIPKGTAGEIVGMIKKPKKFKVLVQGGLLNGRLFWIKGGDLRLAN